MGGGVVSQTESDDSETIYTEDGRPLYEGASDTIYIYNALQTAVSRQDDAADQPVLTGDGDAETFGTGQPIYAPGSDGPLTYSPEHTYVYVDGWDEGLEDAGENNNVVVSDEQGAQEEPDAEKDERVVESTNTEESTAAEDAATIAGAEVLSDGEDGTTGKVLLADERAVGELDGRDYVGQTVKNINGTDYILIGNEQQLRAIGTNKHVVDKVWHRATSLGNWEVSYQGDADISAGEDLANKGDYWFEDLLDYGYCGASSTGELDVDRSANTGLRYAANANYIIFRDINVSSGGNWTPLMFSGTMIGAKAVEGSKIWDAASKSIQATGQPSISGVKVEQSGPFNTEEFVGVGFFGTISDDLSTAAIGVSGYQARV